MKVKFKQWNCIAVGRRYGNKLKAIELVSDDNKREPIAVATVNLAPYDAKPTSDNHVFVKDYSENDGIEFALFEAGIIVEGSTRTVETGHVNVNEYLLTDEALELWNHEIDTYDDPGDDQNLEQS